MPKKKTGAREDYRVKCANCGDTDFITVQAEESFKDRLNSALFFVHNKTIYCSMCYYVLTGDKSDLAVMLKAIRKEVQDGDPDDSPWGIFNRLSKDKKASRQEEQ